PAPPFIEASTSGTPSTHQTGRGAYRRRPSSRRGRRDVRPDRGQVAALTGAALHRGTAPPIGRRSRCGSRGAYRRRPSSRLTTDLYAIATFTQSRRLPAPPFIEACR